MIVHKEKQGMHSPQEGHLLDDPLPEGYPQDDPLPEELPLDHHPGEHLQKDHHPGKFHLEDFHPKGSLQEDNLLGKIVSFILYIYNKLSIRITNTTILYLIKE